MSASDKEAADRMAADWARDHDELTKRAERAERERDDAQAQLERYQRVAESPWSFHSGSLRERLEWCQWQHAYHAEHPSEPLPREAKQDFDRACAAWYGEMLEQLTEIETR